jgi:glutathione S-transferase/maleylpyruvate isomerase
VATGGAAVGGDNMAYELYWISGSPYAWRVQLAFEIKGLSYESYRLNAAEGEHKSDAYLALNPRGKVPTLRDGDTIIRESTAILAYIEAKHPAPPLFGTTAEETAAIWQMVGELDGFLQQPGQSMIRPIFFGQLPEKAEFVKEQAVGVRAELANVEKQLAGKDYLTGAEITAADIVLLPAIQGILRGAAKEDAAALDLRILPLSETYPGIADWVARMEKIPGYGNAFPPHWRS